MKTSVYLRPRPPLTVHLLCYSDIEQYLPLQRNSPHFRVERATKESPSMQLPLFGSTAKEDSKCSHQTTLLQNLVSVWLLHPHLYCDHCTIVKKKLRLEQQLLFEGGDPSKS